MEGERLSPREVADWGMLPPGATIRELMSLGNRLVLATSKGLAILRGMTWYIVQGAEGLPYEDTTCLAPGFANDLWIGTTRGAIRNVDQQYQYFGYQRWIPHDKVNAIACGERTAVIATDGGLGIIEYEPYTLAEKAAWFERWLDEWGQKRLGFIHSLCRSGDEWVRSVCDNDVGYSTHYLAGLCFKYAVTKDPAARAEAVDMMKSVKWSEEITGIDGFPARAVWSVGEKANKDMYGSGGYPAEWNPTPDGRWEWKGDTSSDELIAQVYAITVFLELVAGPEERPWVIEHLDRLIGHFVREGFVLRDLDGKPTRWGRWDPDYLLRPEGTIDRGLNALQTFCFLETAAHFTHDAKFAAAEKQALAWGYADHVLRQKVTFPPAAFTHFDDRLAFYAFFPLLCYETDPALKARWLRSLERSWEIKRIEGLPWFNFIYGATTGNECETERSVAFLRETPLDMRQYSYFNSHRADLKNVPPGYRMYAERIRPLSPRETTLHRWDGDFFSADWDGRGMYVEDCGGWIEAYWMARYFGFLTPPQATDVGLISVPKRGLQLRRQAVQGPAAAQAASRTFGERLALRQSCFNVWHSRPRLWELPYTAEGSSATWDHGFMYSQTMFDAALPRRSRGGSHTVVGWWLGGAQLELHVVLPCLADELQGGRVEAAVPGRNHCIAPGNHFHAVRTGRRPASQILRSVRKGAVRSGGLCKGVVRIFTLKRYLRADDGLAVEDDLGLHRVVAFRAGK